MSTEFLEIVYVTTLALFIIFVLDKLLYLDISKLGWRRARREFPVAATQLGLEYILPVLKDYIGQIVGEYQGYQVSIRPDDTSIIQVMQVDSSHLRSSRLMVSTYKSQLKYPPENMKYFNSGNVDFDKFFRARFAHDDVANYIKINESKLYYVGQFRKTWGNIIRYVEVDDFGVRCSLKYGVVSSYIPTEVLKKILPDLCELAKFFELLLETNERKEK